MNLRLLLPFTLLAASCTVGPNYKRPDVPGSKGWKEGKATASAQVPDEWWKQFHDTTLNQLVAKAQSSNQDLQGAIARVETARALIGVKRADWFPQLGMTDSFSEVRNSSSTFGGGLKFGAAKPKLEQQRYHSSFDLSYEADVWGRIKRGVESAKATMQGAEDALDANRLTIAAEVAKNYFLLRSLDVQRTVVQDTIKSREETLNLQETKFKAGLSNESDTTRARTELSLAKSDLITVERQRGTAEHALAVLCGQAPAGFHVAANGNHNSPPSVPVGLPSDLLERRPDVRAAEQKLKAASADIGVATAAFFPSFKLLGSGGYESLDAGTFLNWENRILSFGPSISLPILNGGRNKANLKAAQSTYNEALAAYRQTLLGAFREVEDALLDLKSYAAQRKDLEDAMHSSEDTERLARTRNEKGLTSYFEVVDANRTVLQTKLSLAQLEGQRMVATVQLYKALGGGAKK
jgi:outer membrane protein, multidrug efflux system